MFSPTVLLIPSNYKNAGMLQEKLLPLLQTCSLEGLSLTRNSLEPNVGTYHLDKFEVNWRLISSEKELFSVGDLSGLSAGNATVGSAQGTMELPSPSTLSQPAAQYKIQLPQDFEVEQDGPQKFSRFVKKLITQSRWYRKESEHETFNHPVAFVYVITGNAPIQELQDVWKKMYDSAFVSPDVLRFNMVFSLDGAGDHLYAEVKRIYGLHCFMLKLSTPLVVAAPAEVNLLDMDIPPPVPAKEDPKDRENVMAFVKEFTLHSLIPFMDSLLLKWNDQVVTSRKGLARGLQQARRLFSSSSRTSSIRHISFNSGIDLKVNAPVEQRMSIYPYATHEAMLRRCGDFAFMLGDIRYAENVYRDVKRDYQNDKANKYYAGVLEMIGLCHIFLNDKKDAESVFEMSVKTYSDNNYSEYALRTCLLFHEAYKQESNYKDCIKVLIRKISDIDPILAAMFYEQCSLCCLKLSNKPLIRKSVFYLTLAGIKYLESEKYTHFIRCFKQCLDQVEGKGWLLIEDYLNSEIGNVLMYKLGRPQEAAAFYGKCVSRENRHQLPSEQGKYLNNFLNCAQETIGSTLPTENTKDDQVSVVAVKPNSFEIANKPSQLGTAFAHNDEELTEEGWKDFEKDLFIGQKAGNSSFCVKEPFFVSFVVKNPLLIPLELQNVKLLTSMPETDIYTYESIKIMPGLDVKLVFKVIPLKEGPLTIEGFTFRLFKKIDRHVTFPAQKKQSLQLTVFPPMPRLVIDTSFQSGNEKEEIPVLAGQVISGELVLKNVSDIPISSIKVKSSHRGCILIGTKDIDAIAQEDRITLEINNQLTDHPYISIPTNSNVAIAPNSQLKIPILFRFDKTGKHLIRLSFLFNSTSNNNSRTTRHFCRLTVNPSLKLNCFTKQSETSLDKYLLGMELQNLSKEEFTIDRIECQTLNNSTTLKVIANDLLPFKEKIKESSNYFSYCNIITSESSGAATSTSTSIKDDPELYTSNRLLLFLRNELKQAKNQPITATLIKSQLEINNSSTNTKNLLQLQLLNRNYWKLLYLKQSIPLLEDYTKIFTLFQTNEVDLIVYWSSCSGGGGGDKHGYHCVHALPIGHKPPPLILPSADSNNKNNNNNAQSLLKTNSLFESTIKERKQLMSVLLQQPLTASGNDSMISYLVETDQQVYNNSNDNTLVKVTFKLKNNSHNQKAKALIELLSCCSGSDDKER